MGRRRISSTCTLSSEDLKNKLYSDCREILKKNRFQETDIALYIARINDAATVYRDRFGEDKIISYTIVRHFKRIDCTLIAEGVKASPFDEEKSISTRQQTEKILQPLLVDKISQMTHVYVPGRNIVTVTSPVIRQRNIIKSPMLWAVILGIICGFICMGLPEAIRTIILNGVLNPVFKVAVGVVTGIMAPVIFFSLLTSISALQSISELTNLGLKILGRFIRITVCVIIAGLAIMLLFYHNFGISSLTLEAMDLMDLILGIIPRDIISPFLAGNTPQLVVMAFVFGAALLISGKKVSGLKDTLGQVNTWVMQTMRIVMTIVPVIPFISITSVIAKGEGTSLLNGWEFIAASYGIAIVLGLLKIIIVCTKHKLNAVSILKKLRPLISEAFSSANNTTILRKEYEISERELHISPEFSGFWIPMSHAMLNPRQTISMLIPPILILKYMEMPISTSFLIIFILLLIELSIANPGTTGAWTILLASLALPSEYVGTFMLYRLFTANFNAAYGALEAGLEQIDAASAFGAVDLDKLRKT